MTRVWVQSLAASLLSAWLCACGQPRISLGDDRGTTVDPKIDASTLVQDDDDAAAPARTDDFDDVTPSPGSHECLETELVCGKDGKTYRNRCDADAAGVKVASQGACP